MSKKLKSLFQFIKRKWFILAFLGIITLPFIQMNSKFFEEKSILNEKREKATKPVFSSKEPLEKYFSEYEAYFKDNFGFREDLIKLNNKVELDVFKDSPNGNVILGKNDFLFTSEEMDDYNKVNLLSDEDLDKIAKNIKKFQDDLKEHGKNFLFTIAPNKSTIYPEYMKTTPTNPNDKSNLDRFKSHLDSYGVNYLDLKELLLSNKDKYSLYYKRDTHWNNIAASLVADKIINYFGENYNIQSSITPTNIEEKNRMGDLDEMLGVDSKIKETICTPKIEGNNIKIPKILSYFDSFGIELMPILDNYFNQRIGFHNLRDPIYSNYPQFSENSNVVLFEMVERYIPKLLDYDFNIYDDKLQGIEGLKEHPLNLDPTNPNLKINNFIAYKKDFGYSYGSMAKENSLTWNFDPINSKYLNIQTEENKVYNQLKIYFGKTGEDFTEENSITVMLTPIKNNYLIPIDKFGDIDKIKICSPLKKTVDINLKNISIY